MDDPKIVFKIISKIFFSSIFFVENVSSKFFFNKVIKRKLGSQRCHSLLRKSLRDITLPLKHIKKVWRFENNSKQTSISIGTKQHVKSNLWAPKKKNQDMAWRRGLWERNRNLTTSRTLSSVKLSIPSFLPINYFWRSSDEAKSILWKLYTSFTRDITDRCLEGFEDVFINLSFLSW